MQVREINLSDYTPISCPEDSVFFTPMVIDSSLILPILIGDSIKEKHYLIRSINKYMTFREENIGVQALGWINHLGSITFVFALEKEHGQDK